jgi:hypothetical protein
VDVTEVTRTPSVAPPPSAQPPFILQQPMPQPVYPQQQPYPQQPYQQAYAQPQAGYPQPPAGYPQPQAGYPQPPVYAWGTQPPPSFPPPQPKISLPRRTLATAAALVAVAVLALVGGLSMAQPSGGGSAAKHTTGTAAQDDAVRAVWRTATVEQLLPASIKREGTETYIRLGINPDESCAKLPAAFVSRLVPGGCAHVLSATYADRTQTVTATVGIVVVSGSIDDRLRLNQLWTTDSNSSNEAMMPHAYPVPRTVAAQFTDAQRVAWQSQISSDGTYVVYAVAGFADGRTGPGAAAIAAGSGSALSSSSPAVQVAGDLPEAIQDLIASQVSGSQDGAS